MEKETIDASELEIDMACILTDEEAWQNAAYVVGWNAVNTDKYLDSIANFSSLVARSDVPKHFPEEANPEILQKIVNKVAFIGITQRLHKFYPLHDLRKLVEVREIVARGLFVEYTDRGGDAKNLSIVRERFIEDELKSINELRAIVADRCKSAQYRVLKVTLDSVLIPTFRRAEFSTHLVMALYRFVMLPDYHRFGNPHLG